MDVAAYLGHQMKGLPIQAKPSEFMETLKKQVQTAVSIQKCFDNQSTSDGTPVELEERDHAAIADR